MPSPLIVQAVGQDLLHVAAGTITIVATGGGGSPSTIILLFGTQTTVPTSITAGAGSSSVADFSLTALGGGPLGIFSIPNVPSGVTSVVVNSSAAQWQCAIAIEVAGLLTASILDQKTGTTSGTSVATWSSGSVTTTQASEMAIGLASIPATGPFAYVPDTGWTEVTGTGITNGQVSDATDGINVFGMWRVLTTTGAYQASGTGPTDNYSAIIGTYKAVSGGSNTSITPATGAAALTGNAPKVVRGTRINPLTAFSPLAPVAQFKKSPSGLLVPERKIFLPTFRKAA